MARKAQMEASATRDSWPVEWTCAVAVLIFFLTFHFSGQLMPRFFSTQCTHQQGMCTAGSCSCTAPRIKRELMTQDAVACFQCVSEYCPAVAEGDGSCSSSPCECEDPSWPRKNIGGAEGDCWQCVHPPLDLTVQPGGRGGECFAPAAAEARRATGVRLKTVAANSSECLTFRFNGALMYPKTAPGSCLAWISFGGYWGLLPCSQDQDFPGSFKQHLPSALRTEEPGAPDDEEWEEVDSAKVAAPEDVFCTGTAEEALFCVEPAEYICTTDTTQCSVGRCKCEDPAMVKRELQTLNGTTCYTCALPLVACPLSEEGCMPSCECTQPGYVKVQHGNKACFSCRAPTPASWAANAALFLLCVSAGLFLGYCLKRMLVPAIPRSRKGKRPVAGTGSWSERWSEWLEDQLEAVMAFAPDKQMSRALRRAGRLVSRISDKVDEVLDPVITHMDNIQDRVCAACKAAYVAFKAETPSGQPSSKRRQNKAARAAPGEKAPRQATAPRSANAQEATKEGATSSRAAEDAAPQQGTEENVEARTTPFIKAFSQCLDYAKAKAEDFDWDPLNVSGKSKNSVAPTVTIPQEWMMRLVPPAAAAVATAKQRAQAAASSTTATLPTQRRALKKLQQRREAAAAAAAATQLTAQEKEVPLDESWIEEMEQSNEKERQAKEAKAAKNKEKRKAKKGKEVQEDRQAEREAEEAEAAASEAEEEEAAAVEVEEDEEDNEVELADEEDVNEVGSVQSADAAGGAGSSLREVSEADKPRASQHVEELLRMVGAGDGDAAVGPAAQDQIFREAMQGLLLLKGASNSEEVEVPEQKWAVVGDADAGAGDASGVAQPAADKKKGQEQKPEAAPQEQPKETPAPAPKPVAKPAAPAPVPKVPSGQAAKPVAPQVVEEARPKTAGPAQARPQQPQGKAAPQPDERPKPPPPVQQPQPPQQRKPPTQAPWAKKPQAEPSAQPVQPKAEPKAEESKAEEPKAEEPKAEVKETAAEAPAEVPPEEVKPKEVKVESKLAADAPDFVPFAMMTQNNAEDLVRSHNASRRGRGRNQAWKGDRKEDEPVDQSSMPITTVMISGIPNFYTPDTFRAQLDNWGLMGTYNFFYMPAGSYLGPGYCFVNFIDPTFASLCQMLFQQYQFEGTVTAFHVQGLENNIAHWNQFEDALSSPLVIPAPTPSQWAVNGVNTMLNSKFSPQIREQFHKTKLCVFHKKNKCALGSSCPFAHTREELMPTPDLAKTKLCYNFFRRRCNDSNCKFAHGYKELRATNNIYKTELCRWWSYGGCKAGSSCRYAHGVEELRRAPPIDEGFDPSEYMQGMDPEAMAAAQEDMSYNPSYMCMAGYKNDVDESYEAFDVSAWGGALAEGEWAETCRVCEEPEPAAETKVAPVDSVDGMDDGKSDICFSDVSFSLGDKALDNHTQLRRQQTAPPTSATSFISEMPRLDSADNIVLRVKGTFMEALQIDMDTSRDPMHRSWSDGDLQQLCEVMECMEDYDEES